MSTETDSLEKKPTQASKKVKNERPGFRSGQIFLSEKDFREMEKYVGKLIKQLGVKTGTRSRKV